MSAGKIVHALLTADAGVNALCAGRVSPMVAEEGVAMPYAVYHVITGNTVNRTLTPGALTRERMQITTWDHTYAGAQALAAAVAAAIERKTGPVAGSTLRDCVSAQYVDLFDPETSRFGVAADYLMVYTP
jgi:hypothetical protein